MTAEISTEIASSTPETEVELAKKDGYNGHKPNSYNLLNITRDDISDHLSEEVLEAHQQAISAQKSIISLRPTPPAGVSPYGNKDFNDTNENILIASAILTPVFLGLNALSFGLQEPIIAYVFAPLLATSGFFFMKTIGSLYNPYNNKKQPIKKFLSKIFLTSNQRNELSENYRKHKEYMVAFNSYQLFIETKLATLKKTGALDLIALNCDKPWGKEITVNQLGEFKWGHIEDQKVSNPNNIELTSRILKEIEAESKKLAEISEKPISN